MVLIGYAGGHAVDVNVIAFSHFLNRTPLDGRFCILVKSCDVSFDSYRCHDYWQKNNALQVEALPLSLPAYNFLPVREVPRFQRKRFKDPHMFELTVLGVNVLLPSLVALTAGLVVWKMQPAASLSSTEGQSSATRVGLAKTPTASATGLALVQGLVVSGATAVALAMAFGLRNGWAMWHEDAWMRWPTAVVLVALAGAVTAGLTSAWLVWTLRILATLIASGVIFPTGEAWEFLWPVRFQWWAVMTISTVVGWYLCHAQTPQLAAILALNWIVLLVAAAYLTSQSFLKVTEPLMAVASVLGCLSLFSLGGRASQWVSMAAGPCLFATSAAVASAQFNSFLGLPDRLSWFTMATPSLLAMAAYGFTTASSTRGLVRYAMLCLIVSLALAAAVIGWTNGMLPAGGEEW